MCEILICVKDRDASNPRAPKQGDVICVQPDGWVWGACELGQVVQGNPNRNHNFFRVIKLPNVTVLQASVMLSSELDVDPQRPSPYLQFRALFFDKSKIVHPGFLAHWNDDSRAAGFLTLSFTAAQIATIKTQRTPVAF
jgi:hypothetical protein